MASSSALQCLLCAVGTALLVCVAGSEESGGTLRFKRFPETISPDGKYVLAWGDKLPEGAAATALVEAPYQASLHPQPGRVQDYLIDTQREDPPLPLPKFEYFSGADGHENGRALTYAWSPDSEGALVVYGNENGYLLAAWVDPIDATVTDLGPKFEKALRGLVAERFGQVEEMTRPNVFFSRCAVLEPGLLTLDACLTRISKGLGIPVSYWFRLHFQIISQGKSVTAKLVGERVLQAEDLPVERPVKPAALESEFEKALDGLRAVLPAPTKETLRKEQAAWLKQREEMENPWNRAGFTRHRLEELKIRTSESRPAAPP